MQKQYKDWGILSGFSGLGINRKLNFNMGNDGDLILIPEIHWIRWMLSGKYSFTPRNTLQLGGTYTVVQKTIVLVETQKGLVFSSVKIRPEDFGYNRASLLWARLQTFFEIDWFYLLNAKRIVCI